MSRVTAWVLHRSKVVLVESYYAGVPLEAVTLREGADPDAPTTGDMMIDTDDYRVFPSWKSAGVWARRKAKRLGYDVDYSTDYPYGVWK